jgi:hypothetical protein
MLPLIRKAGEKSTGIFPRAMEEREGMWRVFSFAREAHPIQFKKLKN